MLQPRQTFKSLDSSGCLGFLQLQLLTLPGKPRREAKHSGVRRYITSVSTYCLCVFYLLAGMSGAPVCNMSGHVVGMLVKKFDMCG